MPFFPRLAVCRLRRKQAKRGRHQQLLVTAWAAAPSAAVIPFAQHCSCIFGCGRAFKSSNPTPRCSHPAGGNQAAQTKAGGLHKPPNCRDSLGAGIPALKTRD